MDTELNITAYLKLPGEGEKTNSKMVIKARAAELEGDFSVMEGVLAPGELLAPHVHDHEAQLLYVISGQMKFELGGKEGIQFLAPAGSYVIKPKGVMHAFWNDGDVPARYIELSGGSHFEHFVDSKSRGDLYAMTHAYEHGMTPYVKDTLRLMGEHRLKSLAMLNLPKLQSIANLGSRLFKGKS